MGLLRPLGQGQGHLKAGFLGFAGSGKTYTSVHLLIGLRKMMELDGPIVMFDTEGGSEFIAEIVKEGTGKDLIGVRSHSLADLMQVIKEAEEMGASGVLVDSITHVWKELQTAHLAKVNENLKRKRRPRRWNLEFQDWGPIKAKWSEWTDVYLNAPLNIVICGRAGFEYGYEENADTGKKELRKTGTKMKAESEFGYEPSLLVEMERVGEEVSGRKIVHQATILKDRYGLIDGKQYRNPTFRTFLPHVRKLVPGAHATIDMTLKTQPLIDEDGIDYGRKRNILLDELKEELVRKWPSTKAEDKKAKADLLEEVFGTRSWERVSSLGAEQVQGGLREVRKVTHPQPEPEQEQIPFGEPSAPTEQQILVEELSYKLKAMSDLPGFNEQRCMALADIKNWSDLDDWKAEDLKMRLVAIATIKTGEEMRI